MKNKLVIDVGGHFFQTTLPLGCWKPVCDKRQNIGKRLLKRYQKKIDSTLAGVAIGLMLLSGIWVFLEQLAAHGG